MMKVNLVHVPKTGGTAVMTALRENGRNLGHAVRLVNAPSPVMAIVRDPVERYLACWDVSSNQRQTFAEEYERWPTPEATILSDEAFFWAVEAHPFMFTPMVFWLESADYALARCLVVARTETLDDDWADICEHLRIGWRALPASGTPTRNEREHNGVQRSRMSEIGVAACRERYAADYRFLDELGDRRWR